VRERKRERVGGIVPTSAVLSRSMWVISSSVLQLTPSQVHSLGEVEVQPFRFLDQDGGHWEIKERRISDWDGDDIVEEIIWVRWGWVLDRD